MGNKQSMPKEMLDRIDVLKKRINSGKFGNTDQGEEDVKVLLEYWNKKYGNNSGKMTVDVGELLKENFNCETIENRSFCIDRIDSGCRWEPYNKKAAERYSPGSKDQINFAKNEGLCRDVEYVTKLTDDESWSELKLKEKGHIDRLKRKAAKPKIADPVKKTKTLYSKGRFDDEKVKRMLDKSRQMPRDLLQSTSGSFINRRVGPTGYSNGATAKYPLSLGARTGGLKKKKGKSRKNKYRKNKSRKGKSRKGKSRKGKSRKGKSRKKNKTKRRKR